MKNCRFIFSTPIQSIVVLLFLVFSLGLKPLDKGYDRIEGFKNGMAKVHKGKTMGFINTNGEEIIACRYHFISDFVNNIAKVMIDEKYGYINIKDEVLIPIKYDYIGPFIKGVAQVKIKSQFGIITTSGIELTDIKYDEIGNFNKYGEAKVRIKRLEGKINCSGEEVIPVYKPIEPE